ncbi:LOW QUALITY PROTEIN: tubulin monoglycylase TTLL3-like [Pezoporus wallicus]|uniref:LOW QUALITY PROTEIN: tubulin monoglycylase TTLL3-like n=1 Tax=Pezoporus wallicus TaxID=35540 RepID=UPI00254D7474|nr:LOW QUALITY PROTEIN: tubulin monoglycylase TTLL3-like [Pezoporus wallicus]
MNRGGSGSSTDCHPCPSTEEGLCVNLQTLPSFYQADPTTFFPRCYGLGDEHQAFIEDFRLTAAHSLLKLAVEKPGIMQGGMESPGKGAAECVEMGLVGMQVQHPHHPDMLEKALQVCRLQLDRLEHTDIDGTPQCSVSPTDCFLHEYYRVVNEQARLEPSIPQLKQCRALLQKLQERLPQLHTEGLHNLWIIKPGAMSPGRGEGKGKMGFGHRLPGEEGSHRHHVSPLTGITCSARLEEILELPGKLPSGMKEAVVAALHRGWELVRDRKSSFELYGADFMFGEDCQPWLPEINVSPTIAPCSAVTRQLCAAVQRDILRVVLDHRGNPGCSTGAFELIYKEPIVPVPPCLGLKLVVEVYSLMKPQLQKQQPRTNSPPPCLLSTRWCPSH